VVVETAMRPLKLGIILDTFEEDEADGHATGAKRWPEMRTFAQRAEALGFDSLWVPDHLLWREEGGDGSTMGMWEGWSILAALAASTNRIELGTLVACTAFRNPSLLAKMADTVDEISGGRLILGLGAGYHEPEFRAFGYPYDHRASRFDEALRIVTTLLREGEIDFAGTYSQARNCELRPRGPRPGGPPILVAGGMPAGPRMLRLGAERADLWNDWLVWGRSWPDAVPPKRQRMDEACAAVGRDPASLERTATIQVAFSGEEPGNVPTDEQPLVGTSEELAEAFRGFAREGISHLQLVLHPGTEADLEALAPALDLLDRD
jgi:alkanesulfonate monooxygenase SsuD/methylene tetrahydromethanopterin reductase-like flavin-dependent oxidoreductase (luciferase family)